MDASTQAPTGPTPASAEDAHGQDVEKHIARPTGDTTPEEDSNETDVPVIKALGWLDRFLAVWIFLAMAIGIILGAFVPSTARDIQRGEFVGVSVPIAVGLLVMMYPILCKVRYEKLHEVLRQKSLWKQLGFSVFVNWIVAPFLMLGLAWAFLPDEPKLRNGLILVGLGRCIAMVLIWNGLADGDSDYCAILVAVNSILQMVLFAPMAVFFVHVIGDPDGTAVNTEFYNIVAKSVGVFLGIPLAAAILTRYFLRWTAGQEWYQNVFLKWASPWSLIGLLYTIIILFASQGQQVSRQVVSVVRVAAPLVVYFIVVFFVTLWTTRKLGFGYRLGCTQSFTAASNNFELAIAVAVATFGPQSEEALAATVGPLIEVPVLVALVYLVRWMRKRWTW